MTINLDWGDLAIRLALALVAATSIGTATAAETPSVSDDRLKLELFAAEPDIVTPVGMTVDDKGRVLVIESHTHFRPAEYQGPPADRIRRFEDTDGDGRADRITTFSEGSSSTMGIAWHPHGWLYVAPRDQVFRVRDTDGDGVADQREQLIALDTADHYPHSGISGFAIDGKGDVFFGLGENHALPFKMTGTDGTVLSGIEGGHVYRMQPDGSKLERVSIGCWNPFHVAFDLSGRLFAVDNDPDSLPPCRLLHIVPGGDYGYKYRNGRKGTHPFTAWNGELPGTLPMVAGTGEAPSGIWPCGKGDNLPADYRGDLLVTSWGDHRIERYVLKPRGASVTAERIDLVKGDDNFRPVGIVAGGDGAVYFSDWVDKSYTLHNKGRIWRLRTVKSSDPARPLELKIAISSEESRAASLRAASDVARAEELWKDCEEADPFIQQAAREGLKRIGAVAPAIDLQPLDAARRLAVELILRDQNTPAAQARLADFLKDPDPSIRLVALRWIGEEKVASQRPALAGALVAGPATARLFASYLAAVERLDRPPRKDVDEWTNEQYVVEALFSDKMPLEVRRWALRTLRPDHPTLSSSRFRAWLSDAELQTEAIRSLRESLLDDREKLLWEIADDTTKPTLLRCEAIVGLRPDSPNNTAKLVALACGDNRAVGDEALRGLRGAVLSDADRDRLKQLSSISMAVADLAARVFDPSVATRLPADKDLDGWLALLQGPADAAAGERIFFHAQSAACNRCHRIDGRGAQIGPELSTTARILDRRRLLESILQPNKEIAPQFVSWAVQLTSGRSLSGMLLSEGVSGEQTYVEPDGKQVLLKPHEIESRKPQPISIMPEGLVRQMTAQEFRDLLAFLQNRGAGS